MTAIPAVRPTVSFVSDMHMAAHHRLRASYSLYKVAELQVSYTTHHSSAELLGMLESHERLALSLLPWQGNVLLLTPKGHGVLIGVSCRIRTDTFTLEGYGAVR